MHNWDEGSQQWVRSLGYAWLGLACAQVHVCIRSLSSLAGPPMSHTTAWSWGARMCAFMYAFVEYAWLATDLAFDLASV